MVISPSTDDQSDQLLAESPHAAEPVPGEVKKVCCCYSNFARFTGLFGHICGIKLRAHAGLAAWAEAERSGGESVPDQIVRNVFARSERPNPSAGLFCAGAGHSHTNSGGRILKNIVMKCDY